MRIAGIVAAVVLIVLVGIPILFVLFAALSDVLPRPGNISLANLSLETIGNIIRGSTLNAAKNSLLIAFGSSLVALVIGTSPGGSSSGSRESRPCSSRRSSPRCPGRCSPARSRVCSTCC
jgi:ABC-type Fe3+ transport system permease subunit